jgi:hypothetical protein
MRYLYLFLFAVMAPVFGSNVVTMYPVPADALNVDHAVSDPGWGAEDFFWLHEPYPGTSALVHYRKIFTGWRPCFSKKEWFVRQNVAHSEGKDNTVYVHQIMEHWVNRAGDTAVTVALTYSPSDPTVPGNRGCNGSKTRIPKVS